MLVLRFTLVHVYAEQRQNLFSLMTKFCFFNKLNFWNCASNTSTYFGYIWLYSNLLQTVYFLEQCRGRSRPVVVRKPVYRWHLQCLLELAVLPGWQITTKFFHILLVRRCQPICFWRAEVIHESHVQTEKNYNLLLACLSLFSCWCLLTPRILLRLFQSGLRES